MLYETGDGTKRLFKEGDEYHPWRDGGRIIPKIDDIPPKKKYLSLLEWYEKGYKKKSKV